ncbi:MAG: hypothetical protein JXR36_01535, partial [Bacteroidales bacterium]|nr:hypothetical protein [Bacteroidales bacterium]
MELADIYQQFKRIDYDYDLISGNVKKVSYQTGEPDQFHHRYWYDADNRITLVETSDDNINWQQDAKYFYYKHGPLARVELGNDKVQALDYAYTLQGWLKGVNSDALDASRDIGKDGDVNLTEINPNQFVGADQFGFSLGYYQGDYTPVGGANAQFLSNMAGSTFATAQVGLYNGNISHMVNSSRHVNNQIDVISMGFAYQYDQLNRIRNMVTYEGLENNTWSSADSPTASSSYTYDKNGNLETLNRSNRNSAP